MSKLAEFKALEAQLAAQLQQLDQMKNDSGLKREIEFETKLQELLAEYNVGLKQVIAILDPHYRAAPFRRYRRSNRASRVSSNATSTRTAAKSWKPKVVTTAP